MSIADAIEEGKEEKRRAHRCPFGRLLDSLPDEDRVALEECIAEGILSTQKILQIIHNEGLRSSRDSLGAHRRGECSCGSGR